MSFDFDKLRGMVRAKKEREDLAYGDIQAQAGVHRTTVCHFLLYDRKPRAEAAVKLAAWLGLSLEHFTSGAEPAQAQGKALESIEDVLRHDPKLSPADAEGLMTIMRTAYRRAVRG